MINYTSVSRKRSSYRHIVVDRDRIQRGVLFFTEVFCILGYQKKKSFRWSNEILVVK